MEEGIKARFLAAFNQLLNGKDALLEDCRIMQNHLTNCSAIDAELDELLWEVAVVTELPQRLVLTSLERSKHKRLFQQKFRQSA